MNKKIAWWIPQIGKNEYAYIQEVLEKSYPNEGYLTKQFEDKICELLNCKYAVTTTSGTTALFLALKALGIGHGDQVLVPNITFIATANAVKMAGAEPVLVDVDKTTANICTESLEKAITPQTKAVIPVHVSGRGADMETINALAKQYNLYVVEDAAEAFMSKHKGHYLGTWSDAGCFSFSPHKIITTGQGGVVVTNNEAIYKQLILLKDHGRPVKGTGGDDTHHCVGYNLKFTNLQAAVGLGQLELLNERIEHLTSTYKIYKNLLQEVPHVTLFDFDIENGEVPLWTDGIFNQRNDLQTVFKKAGIDARNYWHPLNTQPPYFTEKKFPISSMISPHSLWLPSNFTLTTKEIKYIVENIKRFYKKDESIVWSQKASRYRL
jgi:perosamine synthetase